MGANSRFFSKFKSCHTDFNPKYIKNNEKV